MTKTCCECRGTGPFGNLASAPDGLMPRCLKCTNARALASKQSPIGRARQFWNDIFYRIDHEKVFADTDVKMTRQEFLDWAIPAITEWTADHPGEAPAVIPVDWEEGYIAWNLMVVERSVARRFFREKRKLWNTMEQ